MSILSIGTEFQSRKVDAVHFRSAQSVLDYEVVIWEPESALYGYNRDGYSRTYRGLPSLDEHDSVRFVNDVRRRRGEFVEMLGAGRALVIFTAPPTSCYVFTGKVETSGTGRNARRTRMVDDVDVMSALPFPMVTVEGQGGKVDVRGPSALKEFWKINQELMYYRAFIQSEIDEPTFFVAGTKRVVGGLQRVGRGIVLTLPALLRRDDFSRQKQGALERRFIDSLLDLLPELTRGPEKLTLPGWTERFQLPGESAKIAKMNKLRNRAERITADIAKNRAELEELQQYKALLTTSGTKLEALVRSALEEMGLEVEPGEPGRGDLLVRRGEVMAVVEVKGVGKSAAEKHAAQLEKWVSEYYADHGVKPKGILIVNAYRDLPVDQRTDPSFPDQMLAYATNREHCLVTTLQLLGLLFAIQAEPDRKEGLVEALFTTTGVYSAHQDWAETLTLRE